MKSVRALILPAVLVLGLSAAHAATSTSSFQVSATINASCVVEADDMSFGTYSPSSSTDLDAATDIDVFCTKGTAYTLKLDIGTGGGSFATRTLSKGADTLNYNLFTAPARTTVWGDSSASTSTVTGTGAGLLSADRKTVYGRLFAGQDENPGIYTSTVTVTVEY